ncbi:MAG: histidine phosphatase family protein [Verrucomicrobiae bacterium]|nr:histidine phosphatase family protein [Verrucomicrobiae bacterium]
MSLEITFLRHGQTPYSREDVFCGAGLDPDLTPEGREMAESVRDSLRSQPWIAIYASPLKRAVQTAEPIAGALAKKVEARDGLREIHYGKWEGLSKEVVSNQYHDDYLRWLADPAWNAPTEGEPAVMIARRALQVIEEIRAEHSKGSVLVVSHKATIRITLCALLGVDVGRFRFRLGCPVGSTSRVEFTRAGPLLHTLADRGHLSSRLRELPGT